MADVLIITALPMEYEAARNVATLLPKRISWVEVDTSTPTPYLLGELRLVNGRALSVALARPTRMGGPATLPVMAGLVERLRPQCLAMCGVCAGNPADVALGDVVISEMVYYYDEGKRTTEGLEGDHRQVPMLDSLVRAAQELRPDDLPSFGDPSKKEAETWLLERIYAGDQPREHPARSRYFRGDEWRDRVRGIEAEGLIQRNGLGLELTDQGRSRVEEAMFYDVKSPTKLPFAIKVGPIASGQVVVKDGRTWDQLKKWGVRSVLALEMEAAALGSTAARLQVPVWFVAKGVMDHADPRKDDRYKPFAARASAEVLFKFLPKVFERLAERSPVGRIQRETAHHSTVESTVAVASPRDDIPDVRVADDPGVRSLFDSPERDKLLPLLAGGKLDAWGRRGNGFPPLSAISADSWSTHFLEYYPAPSGGVNQTFLKVKARPYESTYYDIYLNREQLKRVWHDKLDWVPLLEAARIVFDQTKDTVSADMARAEGDNDAALRWYCYMLIGVKGDGVTRLMELSGTRPPSRVPEHIAYDRPPPHWEIRNGAAVLVDLPSHRIVFENLMVRVSNIPGAVSFILGLDGAVSGV